MTPIASLAGPIVRLQPDSRLVALLRDGHELAFDEIVRRYRASLVRFAAGIGPRSSAEDVVQESLARAHLAIKDSSVDITLRPWLYTIVRNRALNARRDERPWEQLDPQYDGVPQPPTIAAEREELAATIAAIQALPTQQRDSIVMRELEGMSHDDIAAHLGVSKGSVRQLIFRARTTLRDGLGSLVPLPVVRSLLESSSARVATAGAGAGAVVAAGGGGAIGLKGGVALVVAGLAIGSGVAIEEHGKGHDDHVALAAPAHHGSHLKATEAASVSSPGHGKGSETTDDSTGDASERRDVGDDSSSHNRGPGGGDSSGDGGGSGETEHHGGGGSGSDDGPSHESGGDDHSGPGGGGDDGTSHGGDDSSSGSGSGSSGSGGGDDLPTGGDDSGSGSGSGGSGSGSGGSGSGSGGDDGVTDDPPADPLLPDGE